MLKKIMDCIPEEDMSLSVNDSVICASDDVKNILVKRYGLRTYVGAELFTDNPKELFLYDWQLFCRKNSKSIESIWESLNADYSPLKTTTVPKLQRLQTMKTIPRNTSEVSKVLKVEVWKVLEVVEKSILMVTELHRQTMSQDIMRVVLLRIPRTLPQGIQRQVMII